MSRCWPVDGSGQTIAHYPEGFDLRTERRNCRRRYNVAARAARGREELGLPLLLAAGRDIHAPGLHASRLLRRGPSMARLDHARDRRQSRPDSDHVWRGR